MLAVLLVSIVSAEVDQSTEAVPELPQVEFVDERVTNDEESSQEVSPARQERVVQESPKETVSKDEEECSCRRLGGKLFNENFDTYTIMNSAALKPKPGKTYKIVTVTIPVEVDEPKPEPKPEPELKTEPPKKSEPCVEKTLKIGSKGDLTDYVTVLSSGCGPVDDEVSKEDVNDNLTPAAEEIVKPSNLKKEEKKAEKGKSKQKRAKRDVKGKQSRVKGSVKDRPAEKKSKGKNRK